MEKILLIPSPSIARMQIASCLPYGLFSLQAVSRQFGEDVDILHLSSDLAGRTFTDSRMLAKAVVSQVDLSDYDAVGLSTMCNSFHHALNIARVVKEEAPDLPVWMGGPHSSVLAADVLRAFGEIDAVFVGEGETTFAELLTRRWMGTARATDIPGVLTRDGKYIERKPLEDLDSLPYIDDARGFLDAFRSAKPYNFPDTLPLEAERGCPGRCAFCSTRMFWGARPRRKSDGRIISEMRRLQAATGIPRFMLIGDTFGTPRGRLLQFCRTMEREGNDLRWTCNIRMDRLELDDLVLLWKGGCRGFFVGVESASQATLDRVGKGIRLDRELPVIYRAIEHGFLVETSFIIGFPWETREDLDRTYDLHNEMLRRGAFRSQIWTLCPLPGTEFSDSSTWGIRFDRVTSRISADDIPFDDDTIKQVREHPCIFSQFGYCQTRHVTWQEVSATADAASHLSDMYASERGEVSLPA